MARASFEFLGNKQLKQLLKTAGDELMGQLTQALHEEALLTMRVSQGQVPFRKGILKGSKRVFTPEVTGDSVEVWLGYGGAARKYAKILHDAPEGYFSFRNGKKRKYLEDPVERRADGLEYRLLKRMDRILRRKAK